MPNNNVDNNPPINTNQTQLQKKEKNFGGRPLKFPNPKILQIKISEYFSYCTDNDKPISICGLANWLNIDKSNLMDYQNRDGFRHLIKNARQRIEQAYEERAILNKTHAGFSCFALKQFGWRDDRQVEHTGSIGVNVSVNQLWEDIIDAEVVGEGTEDTDIKRVPQESD